MGVCTPPHCRGRSSGIRRRTGYHRDHCVPSTELARGAREEVIAINDDGNSVVKVSMRVNVKVWTVLELNKRQTKPKNKRRNKQQNPHQQKGAWRIQPCDGFSCFIRETVIDKKQEQREKTVWPGPITDK